ncbi:phosphatase PAP2 family protein [Bernardetia sp. OM2101]|uniref:phosphatase PAP2 family protein n=1 Tax=Bernardetia sp. OM2101 TaxID=3344876 RepID=UPI0035D0476C
MKKLKLFLLISLGVLLTCSLFIFFLDKPLTIFLHSFKGSVIINTFEIIGRGFEINAIPVYMSLFIISIILFRKKYIFNFSFLLISDMVCQILTSLLKRFFGRSPPFSIIDKDIYTFFGDCQYCESFPSGHTSSAFCMALSIGLLYPSLCPILLFYACAVAIARVATTLHYFSDIVFGAYLAFLVVYSIYFVFNFTTKQFEKLIAHINILWRG